MYVFLVAFQVLFLPARSSDAGRSFDTAVPQLDAVVEKVRKPKWVEVEGRIKKNSSIYDELVAGGISPREIFPLVASFRDIYDFKSARPGDSFKVFLTSDKRLRKFVYRSGLCDVYVAERGEKGPYTAFKEEIELTREVLSREFTISSSLYRAILDGGESMRLGMDFADIFSWDIDFYTYPQKGDRIKLLFEKYYYDEKFVKYGDILFAKYVGKNRNFSAVRFDDGEFAGYYDLSGHPLRKMFLRTPLKFGVATSSFSVRRFHPVKKKYKAHTGIDYGAKKGTPILATADGTVSFSGWKNGYGKLIIISHGNGYKTYYGHCSALVTKKGQKVRQGQKVALVGRTGVATGNHVHYEIRIAGKPVNPNSIKSKRGSRLLGDRLEEFNRTVGLRVAQAEEPLDPIRESVLEAGLKRR